MNRDFKGVWIPKDIWLNKELTAIEKVIFVEIDSLDNEDHCTAGNDYFAEFCNCSTSAVTKAIKHLKDLGMIEEVAFDGRHRKLKVVTGTRQTSKFYEAESENLLANNISSNTKNNKKSIINNTTTDTEFEFGKKKKPKQNLYDKCLAAINDFTDDKKIRDLLVKYLNMLLENNRERGTVLYTNVFRGKLRELKSLPKDDWEKIIQRTLDNGWMGFYSLATSNKKFSEGVKITSESFYDADYEEENNRKMKEREKNGQRTKF